MSLSFHTSPIPIILRLPRGLLVKVKTKDLKTRVSISDTRFGHSVSQLWWKAQSLHWHDSIQLHDSIHQTFCCRWKLCLKYYTLWRLFFLLLQWFLSLSCHTLSPVRLSIGCWNTVLISIGNQYLWRTLILNPERAQTSRAACCTCRQIERLASKCIYPAIHPTIHPPLDRLICNTECSIEFRHSEYEKFTQPSTQFTEGQFRPHTARTEHYAPPRPFNW